MTGLARRTGRSIRLVRTGIEVTVLAVGWLLGGTVGSAPWSFALAIGPLAQLFLPLFAPTLACRSPRWTCTRRRSRRPAAYSSSSSSRASQVASRSTAVSNSGCASTKACSRSPSHSS